MNAYEEKGVNYMKFYFAPMEGLTGYIYRNAHHTFFNNINKYFSPFIVANQSDRLKSKEINDILPENNQGIILIPQLLTNNAKDFIHTSNRIQKLGYGEVNLNLGCPSGTVVSKNRGSGFLSMREELDQFLDEIFSSSITDISIKTRLGKEQPEEFYELIDLFNKYPIKELIIHPRIQRDYYKNKPNLKIFREALTLSKNKICYNGDLFTKTDYELFTKDFPSVDTLMIGRGLLMNPGLVDSITNDNKLDIIILKAFHDKIYEDYRKILFGDKNVLFKMKELWTYLILSFSNHEKYAKKIKKSTRLSDYEEVVSNLFQEQNLIHDRTISF